VPVLLQTTLLLIVSNVFMTFAWYRPPQESHRPQVVHRGGRQLGVALFEYMFQVPANRIGYTQLSLAQLKICRR